MSMEQPIAFIKWMQEITTPAANFAFRLSPIGGIFSADVSSHAQFSDALSNWYLNNTNTQYLFIVVHGVLDKNNRAIGIGLGKDTIGWLQLWQEVVVPREKPPNVIIMGCRSTDAVADWNGLLKNNIQMPFLVGYNQIVNSFGQRRLIYNILRLLASFMTIDHVTSLDQDMKRWLC